MIDDTVMIVTFVAAIGCGLVGGAFFAFSSFVMSALARLPTPSGIAAMQAINLAAITPLFMLALFGTGVACLFLAGYSIIGRDDRLQRAEEQPARGCRPDGRRCGSRVAGLPDRRDGLEPRPNGDGAGRGRRVDVHAPELTVDSLPGGFRGGCARAPRGSATGARQICPLR